MDINEKNRIQALIKIIDNEFPKNKEFEVFIKQLSEKVKNMDKRSYDKTKEICKNENEDLMKYSDFNETQIIEPKKNVDRKVFQESFSKFEKCFKDNNKEFSETLQGLDQKLSSNNDLLRECINKCAINSKTTSDSEILKCISVCFDNFEEKYEGFAREYYSKLEEIDNKYYKL